MKKLFVFSLIFTITLFIPRCYYLKQGIVLSELYSQAKPLEWFLAQSDLDPEERELLTSVQEIKRFAVKELGLAENKNYTKYLRIKRDYLADVLSACENLSFQQYYWDYLFVGKLPYKGFFSREEAEAEAALLARQGFDIYLRQVDAFSTLGFFSDPIFSFMKNYPIYVLAEIIIHEQVHSTVFLKEQAVFNENLANFIGQLGMKEFIKSKYGEDNELYQEILLLEKDRKVFQQKIAELISSLAELYKSNLPAQQKLELKQIYIEEWKKKFKNNYDLAFKTKAYRFFAEQKINNALLMTYQNYEEKLADLESLYLLSSSDLKRFIAAARKLKPEERDPLSKMKEYLSFSKSF